MWLRSTENFALQEQGWKVRAVRGSAKKARLVSEGSLPGRKEGDTERIKAKRSNLRSYFTKVAQTGVREKYI